LAFMLFFALQGSNIQPNGWILLSPVLVLIMAGLGLGFGIIVSSLTTKYRDLTFLIQFGIQLWMYITPVIYPISQIPEKYRWIIMANPVSSIVEAFKYGFTGSGNFYISGILYSALFAVVLFFISVAIFNRTEKTFMDTV